ncbi:amine oxidase [Aspergillus udagawae]|uniref:Amine oxidase n=1 Tax=Aspergillus udagawae TaxID=91492 RepID=A0ABQ1BEI7_9EURO|nr:amine oxidase [Aspergillus udagawae]GFG00033.1 amine oxidase [Aspergillus udagawae]GFG19169.1 amine oxidase [Aspergillus udagawae]GFG28050.1 amine oxidase [Aspergillus udagawae]
METFDVAVIGAGIAGITAARDLSKKGFSVVLLEARDRVGGRTYLEKGLGDVIELGGAYVHWTQPHVWNELYRHGISLLPPLTARKAYWLADGTVHSGTEEEYYEVVGPAMKQLFADARERFPLPFMINAVDNSDIERESIEDRINSLGLSAYHRDVLDGALAGVVHKHRDHGIAQLLHCVATYFGDYNAFFETAGTWAIEGGTKRLIDAILSESTARIRLSTPVSAIEDRGSKVSITTRAGQKILVRSAIVAVPLNTLGDIKITPSLPHAVRNMIEQKNPVMASKIWVRVRGEIEGFAAFAPIGKHPINAARTERYHDGDTLIMCICSDAAAIRADNREAVQAALQRFVPTIEVVDTASYSWAEDEFSKGGWMMHRPGHLTGGAAQIRQGHGRIHFAGSDIAGLEAGAIEGAMGSAVAAARDVAAALANPDTSLSIARPHM